MDALRLCALFLFFFCFFVTCKHVVHFNRRGLEDQQHRFTYITLAGTIISMYVYIAVSIGLHAYVFIATVIKIILLIPVFYKPQSAPQ